MHARTHTQINTCTCNCTSTHQINTQIKPHCWHSLLPLVYISVAMVSLCVSMGYHPLFLLLNRQNSYSSSDHRFLCSTVLWLFFAHHYTHTHTHTTHVDWNYSGLCNLSFRFLFCHYHVPILPLSCSYSAIIMFLFCHYHVSSLPLACFHSAVIMFLFFHLPLSSSYHVMARKLPIQNVWEKSLFNWSRMGKVK